jgi:dephospho-CoA kinase
VGLATGSGGSDAGVHEPRCGTTSRSHGCREAASVIAVILVGLTGGIGSGKSTVSARLAARGAVVIDADQIVRDLQRPGSPVLTQLVERFGQGIIDAAGELDRAALASMVFEDPDALAALNGIVHPAVGAEMNARIEAERDGDRIVVLDIPLLTERPRSGLQGIIVVDVPVETQIERLVTHRGFDPDDARARIARQATREERLATASVVVDNSGPLENLEAQIDEVWDWLNSLDQLAADVAAPEVVSRD